MHENDALQEHKQKYCEIDNRGYVANPLSKHLGSGKGELEHTTDKDRQKWLLNELEDSREMVEVLYHHYLLAQRPLVREQVLHKIDEGIKSNGNPPN